MEIKSTFEQLIKLYHIEGVVTDYRKIDSGHMNDTYCVTVNDTDYIFQKVNEYAFKKPELIMENLHALTDYIEFNNKKSACKIVKFIDNKEGKNYTILNGFWRICRYECNTVTYDIIENAEILYSSGFAFGDFINTLSDMPLGSLNITIPDFHNTRKRLNYFFEKVKEDPLGRAKELGADIEVFEKYRDFCCKLNDLTDEGLLPLRLVHNDTKYNNILIDVTTQKPVCIIDLDTVMPGLAAHDFGDAIRFAGNKAAEDETELTKVGLNMVYYKEFTHGFMDSAKQFLTETEIETLAFGAPIITLELASRFLADHIDGDNYFRIHRPNHNLERARCQIRLAEDMFTKLDEMQEYLVNCSQ
ncbi:MAG: aminoglycoside phosphotransferase family protein [Oscillospiraceae bacterium]|nr:aminoglycoside phosphotransferase family protein [Oscillospiraceae bacterium]